jgi:hypothetical protein
MNDTNERSVTSDGSVDAISVLRKLVDGVRGMTFGDPDSPDSIEASTIVRWAIDEIEQQRASIEWYKEVLVEAEEKMARMRLTDAERAVLLGVANDAAYRGAAHTEQTVRDLLGRTR